MQGTVRADVKISSKSLYFQDWFCWIGEKMSWLWIIFHRGRWHIMLPLQPPVRHVISTCHAWYASYTRCPLSHIQFLCCPLEARICIWRKEEGQGVQFASGSLICGEYVNPVEKNNIIAGTYCPWDVIKISHEVVWAQLWGLGVLSDTCDFWLL